MHAQHRGAGLRHGNGPQAARVHPSHSSEREAHRQLARDFDDSDMLVGREVESSESAPPPQSEASPQPARVHSHSTHRGKGMRGGSMRGGMMRGKSPHAANHHKGPRNMRNMVRAEPSANTTAPVSPTAGGTGSRRNSRVSPSHSQERRPSSGRPGQGRSTSGHRAGERPHSGTRGREGHAGSRSNERHPSPHRQGERGSATGGRRNAGHLASASREGRSRSTSARTTSNSQVTRDFDEDLFVRDSGDELFIREVLEALDAREIDELD